jgi:hypothetical protein
MKLRNDQGWKKKRKSKGAAVERKPSQGSAHMPENKHGNCDAGTAGHTSTHPHTSDMTKERQTYGNGKSAGILGRHVRI